MKILGFEKNTVSKTVKDVTDAIVSRAGEFIKWPITPGARAAIKKGYYKQARFPNVIGCIDGTRVRILAPSTDENATSTGKASTASTCKQFAITMVNK